MPKDLASLHESRNIRNMLKGRWGSIPRSVMQAKWEGNELDVSVSYQDQRRDSKHAGSPFDLSGVGARHGGLSRFPQNIARWATNFYTEEESEHSYFDNGLATVLDPFAGHISRMQAVYESYRNYVGWDICHKFQEDNRHTRGVLLSRLKLEPNPAQIELVEDDSRDINYPPIFDFCLSSPPFWDIEEYGPEIGQLGKLRRYTSFLSALGVVVQNCYRALKPGAFIAWEANDFTKEGVFYHYAFDLMQLFRSVGFEPHQLIVVDYGHGFFSSFASDIEAMKLVSKEHSYLVVARKSAPKDKRSAVRKRLLDDYDAAKETIGYQMPLAI